MSTAIVSPTADFSASRYGSVSYDDIYSLTADTPGLAHFVDPQAVSPYPIPTTGGILANAFADGVRGRPWRGQADKSPTTYRVTNANNGRPVMTTRTLTECSLAAQDPTVTRSWTAIMYLVPVAASLGGDNFAFLLNAYGIGSADPTFSLVSNKSGAKQIILQDLSSNALVIWNYGTALAAERPMVLAARVDADAGTVGLFQGTGSAPVIEATGQTIGLHASERWTLYGSRDKAGAWRGDAGITAIFSRALPNAELTQLMAAWRDYYGVIL